MTIFQVYLDETGTHDQQGTIRIAGLMAPHGFWRRFDEDWCAILNDAPPTLYWHTSSARAGKLLTHERNPRLLTSEELFAKEMRLSKLIGDNSACAIGVCIELPLQLHRDHVIGKIDAPRRTELELGPTTKFLTDPVFTAMREALRFSLAQARAWNQALRPGDPFQVWTIFEDNESVADLQFQMGVHIHMLRRMSAPETRRAIGPCIFVQGKGALGFTTIQAADLYAWHVQHAYEGGIMRPAVAHIGRLRLARETITSEQLDRMVLEINTGSRQAL